MNLKNFAVLAACAVSFTAFAQGKAAPADAKKGEKAAEMPMPEMPAEGKRFIEGLLGKWKSSDVTMTMGSKPTKGKLELDCEKTSSGWATLCKGKMDLGKEMPPQTV